ncbi:MAG: DUF3299 domain-containing protein [Pseudomonadota bacterium]
MIDRRAFIIAAAAAASPFAARAGADPLTLMWEDLVPENPDESAYFSALRELGVMKQAENKSPWAIQPPAAMVRDYDDRIVRIPGFIVPLGYDGYDVTEGLLVPYVGACIHVPPPPANQIVYVKLKAPTEQDGLWDPIWATGRFETAAVETALADVGYFMTEATLEPYEI